MTHDDNHTEASAPFHATILVVSMAVEWCVRSSGENERDRVRENRSVTEKEAAYGFGKESHNC